MYKDFLIKELDIKFDLSELLEYLDILERDFSHLKWIADESLTTVNDAEMQGNIKGVYGWGVQSNLEDLNVPCPPYNIHKNGSKVYRNTPLVFGFIEKLLERFPYARQISIAAHPPGTKIRVHTDSDNWLKIHIPIVAGDRSYFMFEKQTFVMEAGKTYLVNTVIPHGTFNDSDVTRIHLFFKIPSDKAEEFL